MSNETTVKVTNKDIIIRIPIALAVHLFNCHADRENEKIIDKEAFAKRLAEMILDIEDSESGIPNWGVMIDKILSEMLDNGEDFIDYD